MSENAEPDSRIARLAARMAHDPRIATPTLNQILRTVDAEIAELGRAGEVTPDLLTQLRATVALACARRRQEAGSAETQSSR